MMDYLYSTSGLTYSMPAGLVPRQWQGECLEAFMEKMNAHESGQFVFQIGAGVGSGKTVMAAMLAAVILGKRKASRVVYVCPNRAIRDAVLRIFKAFNISLACWNNNKHRQGEGRNYDGAVMTYQALARGADIQAGLARKHATLVIFDEIHHLGDDLAWGSAASQAFEHDNVMVLGLSGTPFRSDNNRIPFVNYQPSDNGTWRFSTDYSYTLGRSVQDNVCRQPVFVWLNGEVEVRQGGESTTWTFSDDLGSETANTILSGAVCHGSRSRTEAIREALAACRRDGRKLIIFVGGDSGAANLAVDDAEHLLPVELQEAGVPAHEIAVITSNRPDAIDRLNRFEQSGATVLVTVNMVSEGVDIPSLSAALFLTSITAKATTIQRIGRILRGNDPRYALIYMFRHPVYVDLAREIDTEIRHEIDLARKRREVDREGGIEGFRRLVEVEGLTAYEDGVSLLGRTFSRKQVEMVRKRMAEIGGPQNDSRLVEFLDSYGFWTGERV